MWTSDEFSFFFFFFVENSLPINQAWVSRKLGWHGCGVHSLFQAIRAVEQSTFAHWSLPRINEWLEIMTNYCRYAFVRLGSSLVRTNLYPFIKRCHKNRRNRWKAKKNESKKQRWRNSSPFNWQFQHVRTSILWQFVRSLETRPWEEKKKEKKKRKGRR